MGRRPHRRADAALRADRRRLRPLEPLRRLPPRRARAVLAARRRQRGQPRRDDPHARRRLRRLPDRAGPAVARRLGGGGRLGEAALRRRPGVGLDGPAHAGARGRRADRLVLHGVRARLRPRAARLHARRRRDPDGPEVRPRLVVEPLLALLGRGLQEHRRGVRRARRADRRAGAGHGLAPRRLDRLHLEPRALPRPRRVPRLVRGERPAHHAQPPPRRRRGQARGGVQRDEGGGRRAEARLPDPVRLHGQAVRARVLRRAAPPDGEDGRRLLVDGLAAGDRDLDRGARPAVVAQPPALAGHGDQPRAGRAAPADLQPLGRAREPPLPDRLLGRHVQRLGLARVPAALHGDGVERRLLLLVARHRRPPARPGGGRAVRPLGAVRRLQPGAAHALGAGPAGRAEDLDVPAGLLRGDAPGVRAALRAGALHLHGDAPGARRGGAAVPPAVPRVARPGRGVRAPGPVPVRRRPDGRPGDAPDERGLRRRGPGGVDPAGRVGGDALGRGPRGPARGPGAVRPRRGPGLRAPRRDRHQGAADAAHRREAPRPARPRDLGGRARRGSPVRGRRPDRRLHGRGLRVDADRARSGGRDARRARRPDGGDLRRRARVAVAGDPPARRVARPARDRGRRGGPLRVRRVDAHRRRAHARGAGGRAGRGADRAGEGVGRSGPDADRPARAPRAARRCRRDARRAHAPDRRGPPVDPGEDRGRPRRGAARGPGDARRSRGPGRGRRDERRPGAGP